MHRRLVRWGMGGRKSRMYLGVKMGKERVVDDTWNMMR